MLTSDENITQVYKEYFIPKQCYLDEIGNQKYDIGIFVRKGDLVKYFPEANQSDHDIRKWIDGLSKRYKIIIFSDDQSYQKELRDSIGIPDKVYNPFIQFLTLALRCNIVCGTPKSSFAEQAAKFSGVPYYTNLSSIPNCEGENLELQPEH